MLNRRRIAFWLAVLAVLLAFSHLLGSTGDPHAVVSPDHHTEISQEHAPGHDDETPTCGRASLPTLNAYTPLEFATHTVPPGDAAAVPTVHCQAAAGDRPPPDLVAVLQVNRV